MKPITIEELASAISRIPTPGTFTLGDVAAADRVWALLHEHGRAMYVLDEYLNYNRHSPVGATYLDLAPESDGPTADGRRVLVLNLEADDA